MCRYFPYVNDAETVPESQNQFIEQAQKEAHGGTQAALTQRMVTQASKERSMEVDCLTSDDEDAGAPPAPHPIFEVFWQVRPPRRCAAFCSDL